MRGIGKNDLKAKLTIGIIGSKPGAGATHLAIALSNLCRSKLNKKTALLELHTRKELSAIPAKSKLPCHTGFTCGKSCFSIHGTDYYPNVAPKELAAFYNQGYHMLILDFGNKAEAHMDEFLRCDRKLIIGSLTAWNIRYYEELLESLNHYTNLGEGFYCLTRTESPKQIRDFSHHNQISMRFVPLIPNPFHIKKEHFSILQEFVC